MAVSKLLSNVPKKPSGPEAAFCTMLSTLYAGKVSLLEPPLKIPLLFINRVKSQIKRMEKLIAKGIDIEITYIEQLVIQIFKLDEFNKNKQRSNFCVIAFNCTALVNSLADSPIVPEDQKEAIKTNYALFETIVCKQGLNRIISGFVDEQIAWIIAQIVLLRNKLLIALGIQNFIDAYNALLATLIPLGNTVGYQPLVNMTTVQWLNVLNDFVNCAFQGCDYSESAQNLKADWIKKLALADPGFSDLISGVTLLNSGFESRLDDIEIALTFRTNNMNISPDDIMKN